MGTETKLIIRPYLWTSFFLEYKGEKYHIVSHNGKCKEQNNKGDIDELVAVILLMKSEGKATYIDRTKPSPW